MEKKLAKNAILQRSNERIVKAFPFDEFRENQYETIELILECFKSKKYVILEAPTGTGKSPIGMTVAKMFNSTHYITVQKILQDQYARDFEKDIFVMKGRSNYNCLDGGNCATGTCRLKKGYSHDDECPYRIALRTAQESKIILHNFDSFYYQRMFFLPRDLMVIDECFAPDTTITTKNGYKKISEILPNDEILSFDEERGILVYNRVKKTIKKKTDKILKIRFSNNKVIYCTTNHKFYTQSGWKEASKLKNGIDKTFHVVHDVESEEKYESNMHKLWERIFYRKQSTNKKLQNKRKNILHKKLWGRRKNQTTEEENCFGGSEKEIIRKNEKKQPYAQPRYKKKNAGYNCKKWTHFFYKRRKRKAINTSSDKTFISSGVENGNCDFVREEKERFSDELQIGYRKRKIENRHRGGWFFSFNAEKKRTGCKESEKIEFVGVESIEIFKQGNNREFRSVCDEGFVYDLEVEKTHTYLANDFIVHNCHNSEQKFMGFISFTINDDLIPITFRKLKDYNDAISFVEEYDVFVDQLLALESEEMITQEQLKMEQELISLSEKIKRFLRNSKKENPVKFVFEQISDGPRNKVVFKPIEVGSFTGEFFNRANKVLLMSATILNKEQFCKNTGIPLDQMEYIEMPSLFPVENRTIYSTKEINLTYKTMDKELPKLKKIIENYLEEYKDSRGIIHTHTNQLVYHIKKTIKSNRLIYKDDYNSVNELLQDHERIENSVIVASGFHEGLDLKDELSRFQIVLKIPYPSLGDMQLKARMEIDKEYYGYLTALKLVQSYGRSVRTKDDWCDTYILDSNFNRFYGMYKKMLPKWFKEAIEWL